MRNAKVYSEEKLWFVIGLAALVLGAALLFALAMSQARASDVPSTTYRPAAKVSVAPPFTGGYVGIQGGWGQYDANDRSALPGLAPAIYDGKFEGDGWLGGIQAGYDHQFGILVLGVAADYSWSWMDGSKSVALGPVGIGIPHSIDEFGTARVRAGAAFQNLLIYGTAGAAYAKTSADVNVTGCGGPCPLSFSSETDRVGYTYGAGAEWKFAPNWSLGLEYLHLDFGTDNTAFAIPGGGGLVAGVPVDLDADIFRGSLNFRF